MKILHISTNDFGGAGSAAVRIHLAHKSVGIDSVLLVKNKTKDIDGVVSIKRGLFRDLFLKFKNVIKRSLIFLFFNKKYLMYSALDFEKYNLLRDVKNINFAPDVVIFHWIAGFANSKDIVDVVNHFDCKSLWFLMDSAPLTGGCHFSFECTNYKSMCVKCPADKSSLNKGLPYLLMKNKRNMKYRLNLKFLFPNIWVANQFSNNNSIVTDRLISYIPIDENVFYPIEKENSGEFVILFGSNKLDNPRKGGKYFLEMLNILDSFIKESNTQLFKDIKILIPGFESEFNLKNIPFKMKNIPYARNESELASLYRLSDLFVCCSIEDSGPMMVSESLMSGVPVIGFEMGICPEIIINNYNGAVVPLRNSKEMAKYIFDWIQSDKFLQMKNNARITALKNFSISAHYNQLKLALRKF